MKSVIEPHGADTVTIPIISDFSRGSTSIITLVKSGNVVTAIIGELKASSTVGKVDDIGVIPIGFRPINEPSILIANVNKRGTPESQEIVRINFLPNGDLQYNNFLSSTDNINPYPTNSITYIASGA